MWFVVSWFESCRICHQASWDGGQLQTRCLSDWCCWHASGLPSVWAARTPLLCLIANSHYHTPQLLKVSSGPLLPGIYLFGRELLRPVFHACCHACCIKGMAAWCGVLRRTHSVCVHAPMGCTVLAVHVFCACVVLGTPSNDCLMWCL
jgi:hypothetical protein